MLIDELLLLVEVNRAHLRHKGGVSSVVECVRKHLGQIIVRTEHTGYVVAHKPEIGFQVASVGQKRAVAFVAHDDGYKEAGHIVLALKVDQIYFSCLAVYHSLGFHHLRVLNFGVGVYLGLVEWQSGDPIGVEPAVGSMERGEDIVVKKVLAKDIGSYIRKNI